MSGILPNQAEDDAEENIPLKSNYNPSTLHKKLQKQRQKLQNKRVVSNEPKKTSLMSVSRLQIPNRGYQRIDDSPLVSLQSDSEDELFLSNKPTTARQVNKQLSRQLAKDGFQLDETPDDEALDLIPPNDFREGHYFACCNDYTIKCIVM
ncbi:protein FAM219A-like isoform X1 [Ciona intestinalis]